KFPLASLVISSASVSTGSFSPIPLSGNVCRFLLRGDFRPGNVAVNFTQNKWATLARGPPTTGGFNLAFTRSFDVVGATADLVRTVTDQNGDKLVPLAGSSVG